MSRVGTVIASVSEQVSHMSLVRYRCTRTRGHLQSFVESRVVLHCLEIFGAQSKFHLLVALGVVDGIVLAGATLCSRAAHVRFAHSSGGSDSKTAGFVEISCPINPAPTTARARCWHQRGMSRMQLPISFYTPSGLPRAETQIKKNRFFLLVFVLTTQIR